jgi:hypothetical protein
MTGNLKHKIIQYLNSEYPELERFEMEKIYGLHFLYERW